jgi:hypothetical protein
LAVDVKNIHLLYFINKASVRTIDTRALSVKLLALHPSFDKKYRVNINIE